MEININNYESYLIDYFDGNLNALEVAEVLLFLEQNPEIKSEFEAIGTLPEPETFTIENSFKSQLKKLRTNDNLAQKSFNELFVAQLEGDCNSAESELINKMVAGNHSLIKIRNTFQLTKLKPDLSLVFPHKQALKRKEALIFYLNRKFAAAAAILLLASLLFLVSRNANKNIDKVELAQTIKEIKPDNLVIPDNNIDAIGKNNVIPESQKIIIRNEIIKTNSLPSPVNNNTNFVADINSQIKMIDLTPMLVKPIISIENNMELNANTINGAVIPVEILASNVSEKSNDFLTIGDFMKKKLIERGKNNLEENAKPVETENLALEPITLASVGAGIVEKTTGKKVFLSRSFDKEGSLKSYSLAAGNFKFERIK